MIHAAHESLERLGVDAIDLLYVHWPADTYDPERTLSAFDELVDDGVVERVGLANCSPELLDKARDALDAPLFAHQVEMHPLLQQEVLHEYAVEHDHHLVAYSPIARGHVFDEPAIQGVAERHGVTEAQVSLAWLASKENVVPGFLPAAAHQGKPGRPRGRPRRGGPRGHRRHRRRGSDRRHGRRPLESVGSRTGISAAAFPFSA